MIPAKERVRKHRAGLRAAGLRPIQIWIPDTRKEGFAEECRRQSLLVANDPHEKEILTWIDNVADHGEWS
ncbi:MAG: antitoxin MazE family protein [Thermodesulfobacteriota bacterium]|nr:antitoxin MazE family protein [Thermodesulfobacteriota bacterium]